jgi:hypothetical protein
VNTVSTNYITGSLTPEDREQIMASLTIIREKMPFMTELTRKTKKSLPKMGDKSRAFVHKAMEVAMQHPEVLPRSLDLAEMQRDIDLFEAVYAIAMELNQLHADLEDTLTAVGSDAYSAALQVYRHLKAHGEGSGLDALVDDMGRRFGRKTRKSGATVDIAH